MVKLHFIVFLFGLCGSISADATAHDHYPYIGILYNKIPSPIQSTHQGDIVHPCNLHDLHCMRTFLASNSNCRIANGLVPDPLYIPRTVLDIALINVTVVQRNYQITGLQKAEIVQFYWNQATGNVVIAFNVKNLGMDIPNFTVYFHRRAMESVVLTDYATFTYPDTTFTTVLPGAPHLCLDQTQMLSYVENGNNEFNLGPAFTNSKDPTVMKQMAAYQADLPRASMEHLAEMSSVINGVYIQNNLCDFDVKSF